MARRLLVRQDALSPWVDNFAKGGWKVYHDTRGWVQMKPSNTRLRSSDNQSWECVK